MVKTGLGVKSTKSRQVTLKVIEDAIKEIEKRRKKEDKGYIYISNISRKDFKKWSRHRKFIDFIERLKWWNK